MTGCAFSVIQGIITVDSLFLVTSFAIIVICSLEFKDVIKFGFRIMAIKAR